MQLSTARFPCHPHFTLQIIPAENLVAAYQHNPRATLLAAAGDAASGRVMLEALEAGTDGVLLRTDSPAEVRCRCACRPAWVDERGGDPQGGRGLRALLQLPSRAARAGRRPTCGAAQPA